jgi:beta-phosphoglucomutase
MIRAVIFDFNGVLVDDERVHYELFREVLEPEGVTLTPAQYHQVYLGYDDRACFEHALADVGQEASRSRVDALIARKAERYEQVAAQGLRFFPGASACVTALAGRYPLAVCSGALRREIEYGLTRMQVRDRFETIVSAEDTTRCKPDPQGYLLAWEALRGAAIPGRQSLKARHCMVVEDSLAGLASAKGAGMRAVGISHTYPPDELRDAGADKVVDSLEILTPEWVARSFELF